MAFRYDSSTMGEVIRFDDGRLYAPGSVCRDGILTYHRADGSVVREYRPPEENQNPKFLRALNGLTVTLEHPGTLINGRNRKAFQVGHLDSAAKYNPQSGEVENGVWVTDDEATSKVDSREITQLSLGYACDLDETPGSVVGRNGERVHYDAIQKNLRPNHCALTKQGRAGPSIALKLDSGEPDLDIAWSDSGDRVDSVVPTTQRQTNTVDRRDSTMELTYKGLKFEDVPAALAVAIQPDLEKLPVLEARTDSLEKENAGLAKKLQDALLDCERLMGRADGLEEECRMLLAQQGIREDMDDEGDPDDESDEDPDDEEKQKKPKKGKKGKEMATENMDSQTEPKFTLTQVQNAVQELVKEAVKVRMDALWLADALDVELEPGDLSEELSTAEIQSMMIKTVKEDADLDGKSIEYIAARFDSLKDLASIRQDSFQSRNKSDSFSTSSRNDVDTLRHIVSLANKGLPSSSNNKPPSTTRADSLDEDAGHEELVNRIRQDSVTSRSTAYKKPINAVAS